MYQCVEKHKSERKDKFGEQAREILSREMMRCNQTLDYIAKNTELKQKSKNTLSSELTTVDNEIDQNKAITETKIESLRE